jgi:signal transduction histidine kinase
VLVLLDARRRAELDRRKDAFVCSVTHELRTPIANILLFAETLRDHGRADPDRVGHFAGVIGAEAGLLRARVDEVLDVATGRRRVAVRGAVSPARVLRDVAEESRARLAEAGMALELALPRDERLARGSEDLLRRAVAGLVDNARKYAGRGTLRLSLARAGGAHVLSVEDEGPGVPAAERERIFEPFVRLGDEMTRTVPGTGLGLTLVRQCVELCGGRVEALARAGGGACFRITLPELESGRREEGGVGASPAPGARGNGDADHPAG